MIHLLPLLIVASNEVEHTFTFVSEKPVKEVHLAGAFNNWDKRATRMRLLPDGKTYSVTLRLKPGKYPYKFVLNEDEWIVDPKAARNEDDGTGHTNSILIITPPDYVTPANPADGVVAASALEHVTEVPYFNYDRGQITLSLRARPGDLKAVKVRAHGFGDVPMKSEPIDEFYTRYTASIPWDRRADLRYTFLLQDGAKVYSFGPRGLTTKASNEYRVGAKTFRPFEVPGWVEKSIFYQVFPDRFENGDKSNDPKDVMAWDGKPQYFNRFGGDIAGVQKRMGHLKQLGVNAVYFNPIFKAPSNHRYDATDYFQIDPEFGTNEEFAQLTRDLKKQGIRTVLDGVYNHTATNFFAFDDVVKNGKGSKYTDWYTFKSFPVKIQENPNYVAWFNFPSMPKLNLSNPETREYMLRIPKFWNEKAEIAGWRLDVANEVQMDFWQDFRKVVKGINPDNWIVGEVWGDGSPWLKGDQWDSVMNYRFREAVLTFVGKDGSGKPSQFLDRLFGVYNSYAPQVSRNMMNLIGSHDTPRILTLCNEDRELAKLAAIVQFTWVGAPSVYYGDELGMSGGADPDNRRGMRWDLANPDNDVLALYRKLIALRNQHEVLQSGDPIRLAADDASGIAAYGRVLNGKSAVVVFNRSDKTQSAKVALSGTPVAQTTYVDVLNGKPVSASAGTVSVSLPPKSAAVLIPSSEASPRSAR